MKKTLSLLLAVLMIASCLPLGIFAETNPTSVSADNYVSESHLKNEATFFEEKIESLYYEYTNENTTDQTDELELKPVDAEAKGISYYTGTSIPTYTSVTGWPLRDYNVYDNGNVIYCYYYTLDDYFNYVDCLIDYYGWQYYDTSEADDGSYGTIYLVKGMVLIAITANFRYTETWIWIPQSAMDGSESTVSVTGVSLNRTSSNMTVGDTITLTATVSPSNATNKNVSWSSSNSNVASVSTSGVITAKAAGTATITVKTSDGNKTATCTVTVTNPVISVTGITLDKTSSKMTVGDTMTLTATVLPSNATNKDVIWSSSNSNVASVSSSGIVTAKSVGSATITAKTADGNKTATCTIIVKTDIILVTGISLNKTSATLFVGDEETLIATITPADATNKVVSWSSSDTSVATVSSTGVVTANSAGTATITVTTADGNKTATCEITVNAKTLSFVLDSVKTVAGKTVSVDIVMSNNPGVAGVALSVGYDSSVMTLISYEYKDWEASTSNFDQDPANNPVAFFWGKTKNYTGDTTLVTLTFEIKDGAPVGDYNLTLGSEFGITNQDMQDVECNFVNGTISIIDCIPGDSNGDGAINTKDAVLLAQYLAKWNVHIDMNAADCNGDGAINTKDAVLLAQYLAKWNVTLG